jgi:hypothetical protein
MAWNKPDPQYSTYGDYNDSQFYAAGATDASAYDMFDESQNPVTDPYATSAAGSAWDPQSANYGYYDPSAYQHPSPQPPQQPPMHPRPSSTKGHPPPHAG